MKDYIENKLGQGVSFIYTITAFIWINITISQHNSYFYHVCIVDISHLSYHLCYHSYKSRPCEAYERTTSPVKLQLSEHHQTRTQRKTQEQNMPIKW